jgi:pimeloyl-ACP methyl ester carboxylesterase
MTRMRAASVDTDRLRTHYLESGPEDGIPVVLVHGNLSTGRFYEHLMPGAPERYRLIAPDMRGFGDSEPRPIDATRGLRDWADDTHALVRALGIEEPVHLVGWSTGGAAIAHYAMDRAVASLTFVAPVSPYGYGGTRADGSPWAPDFAGSGGGTGNPELARRIAAGDRTAESPLSPRNVMRAGYWRTDHRLPADREDLLVDEILKSRTGEDGYPGDSVPSEHWPGVAPGTRGILNALSPRYCDWSGLADIDPKPPMLWVQGTADVVIADGAAWEIGTLGKLGAVPGWPGEDAFAPQLMVTQTRRLLERYREGGGVVRAEVFEGSGHFPPIDAADRFAAAFFAFLDSAVAR